MPVSIESLLRAPILAGARVRPGGDADRIDLVRPALVVEPRTAEETAALLAWASQERLTIVFRGGGTKLGWGRVPTPVDLLVSLRGLRRVLAHAHADLTATVEAGTTLRELNDALGRHRQWLPVDAAGDEATVGGAIATNDAGPLRHRYGTPRDLLIGVRLATADGRLVKAGGNVVKNVAGYDVGKLVSGSFGCLAAIVSATFKLLPVPAAFRTLSAALQDREEAAAAAARLNDSQLEPAAVELQAVHQGHGAAAWRLLARFATSPAAAASQVDEARTLAGAGEVIAGDAEEALWRRYEVRAAASTGTVVSLSWLPAALPQVLALVAEVAGADGSIELSARTAAGTGRLRIEGDVDWQATRVDRLRARADLVTHVTIQGAPPEVKARVDAWGPPGPAAHVLSAIRRALDPAGILNAGRGPL